jgi:hypothetical protein
MAALDVAFQPMVYNPNDLSPYPGTPSGKWWGDYKEDILVPVSNNIIVGHICNQCEIESGSSRRCKCSYRCPKHANNEAHTKDIVASLLNDSNTHTLASKHGLSITSVAWEDTGRTKGSCFGPNISDMTLCVDGKNMPIIRKPNFADLTSDQDLDKFSVNVGNETGGSLVSIPLRDYLINITQYSDIKVTGSLVTPRDTQVLTSAQACILPLRDGSVEFGAHFVLGRDNTLDFNKNGLIAKFVAERLKDDRARRGVALEGAMTEEEKLRNALLIFQVPLKYTESSFNSLCDGGDIVLQSANFVRREEIEVVDDLPLSNLFGDDSMDFAQLPPDFGKDNFVYGARKSKSRGARSRGMDHAVLSTSAGSGKYPTLSAHTVERDERMPIRCTIQYYHVTDNSNISEEDMVIISSEVSRHKPVGSLVVGGKTERTTEHTVSSLVNRVKGLFSGL